MERKKKGGGKTVGRRFTGGEMSKKWESRVWGGGGGKGNVFQWVWWVFFLLRLLTIFHLLCFRAFPRDNDVVERKTKCPLSPSLIIINSATLPHSPCLQNLLTLLSGESDSIRSMYCCHII